MNVGVFLPNLFEQSFVPQVQLYVDQSKVKDFPTMSNGPCPTFCIFATGFPLYCTFFLTTLQLSEPLGPMVCGFTQMFTT